MVKKITNFIVWLASGGLLLASLAFVALATPLVGNRALIVRSGSMEPAISVGDVVIVRPGEYQVGDAIAYNVPGRENMIVTHRIVEVKQGEYVTKGDANPEADGWVVAEKDIIGQELFTVPWVGTILAFAKSRVGFLSLVVAPALVIALSEIRVIWRELSKKAPRIERAPVSLATPTPIVGGDSPFVRESKTLAFIGVSTPPVRVFVDSVVRPGASLAALVLMFSVMTPATFALYTDPGTSSNNLFTAADDFGGGEIVYQIVISEVMWMGTIGGGSTDEWLELRNLTSDPVDLTGWEIVNGGSGAGTPISLSGTIPGGDYWLVSRSATDSSEISDSITADQVVSGLSLNNAGEQLTLRDALDVIIDQTPADDWPAGTGTGSTRKSMVRNATPGNGTVDGNWHTCTDDGCNDGIYWDDAEGNNYGTPKAANL